VATADALAAGLLPQWRARVPASLRVAAKLGYRTLGRQFIVLPPSQRRDACCRHAGENGWTAGFG